MAFLRLIGGLLAAALLFAVVFAATARGLAWYRETATASLIAPQGGQFVDLAGTRLFVQARGDDTGVPVLYVPGAAMWSGLWTDAMAAVGGRFRHIAVDLPPFGFSDHDPAANYGRARLAERLTALSETMRLDRPILVAHSDGAGPALEAILRRPDLFRGIVMVSGALGLADGVDGPRPESWALANVLRTGFVMEPAMALTLTNPALTETLLARLLHRKDAATPQRAFVLQQPLARRGTTSAYVAWVPSRVFDDPRAISHAPMTIRRLAWPAAILHGREDTVVPPSQAEALRLLLPQAAIDIMPDVGHAPHLEDPAAFAILLRRRLEEIAARR